MVFPTKECCGSKGPNHKKACPTLVEGYEPPTQEPEKTPETAPEVEPAIEPIDLEEPVTEANDKSDKIDTEPSIMPEDELDGGDDALMDAIEGEEGGINEDNGETIVDETTDTEPKDDSEPIDEVDVVGDLSDHEEFEANDVVEEEQVARMKEAKGLDLSGLSTPQILDLQNTINKFVTRKTEKKKTGKYVGIRIFGKKLVVAFGKAYKKEYFDTEEQRKVIKNHIKLKLSDGTIKEVVYSVFNNLPRVKCLVSGERSVERKIEGEEIMSAEHDKLVPNIIKFVDHFYTVVLPGGKSKEFNVNNLN